MGNKNTEKKKRNKMQKNHRRKLPECFAWSND